MIEIIEATDALSYAQQVALQEAAHAKNALNCLVDSEYKIALNSLVEFSVERIY